MAPRPVIGVAPVVVAGGVAFVGVGLAMLAGRLQEKKRREQWQVGIGGESRTAVYRRPPYEAMRGDDLNRLMSLLDWQGRDTYILPLTGVTIERQAIERERLRRAGSGFLFITPAMQIGLLAERIGKVATTLWGFWAAIRSWQRLQWGPLNGRKQYGPPVTVPEWWPTGTLNPQGFNNVSFTWIRGDVHPLGGCQERIRTGGGVIGASFGLAPIGVDEGNPWPGPGSCGQQVPGGLVLYGGNSSGAKQPLYRMETDENQTILRITSISVAPAAPTPDAVPYPAAPKPLPLPATPPTTEIPWPGAPPIGLPGQQPRPDMVGIAQELGKIERKLAIMNTPTRPVPPALNGLQLDDKLGLIWNLLQGFLDAGEYKVWSPCLPQGEAGSATDPLVTSWGASLTPFGGLENRLNAIAQMIQDSKVLPQPTCRKPAVGGEWVTVQFESDQPSPAGERRLRKVFRYLDQTFSPLEDHVQHWAGFSWEAGPWCVSHNGGIWGNPQVWASSADEGKRVIRHAAAIAGVDVDATGSTWQASRSTSSRTGQPGLMRVRRGTNMAWLISKRLGTNGLPEYLVPPIASPAPLASRP